MRVDTQTCCRQHSRSAGSLVTSLASGYWLRWTGCRRWWWRQAWWASLVWASSSARASTQQAVGRCRSRHVDGWPARSASDNAPLSVSSRYVGGGVWISLSGIRNSLWHQIRNGESCWACTCACKGKHWNVNHYKLLSYYNNGWYARLQYYPFTQAHRPSIAQNVRNVRWPRARFFTHKNHASNSWFFMHWFLCISGETDGWTDGQTPDTRPLLYALRYRQGPP